MAKRRIRKLYGVGVGPGDPELITLKAYKVLKTSEMLIAPRSDKGKRSLALHIVEEIVDISGKIIIEPLFPMCRDENKLKLYWNKAREEILEKAANGCELAAFVTLGDPGFYSTFYKFLSIIKSDVEEVEVIPGISSFSACASAACLPIAEDDEIVSIIPNVEKDYAMRAIQNSDIIILLKPKNIDKLRHIIGDMQVIFGEKVGFEDQRISFPKLSEIANPPYLSTLIIRRR